MILAANDLQTQDLPLARLGHPVATTRAMQTPGFRAPTAGFQEGGQVRAFPQLGDKQAQTAGLYAA